MKRPAPPREEPAEILRKVLAALAPSPRGAATRGGDVLLDHDVDGVRYLLVREAPAQAASAKAGEGATAVAAPPAAERSSELSPREWEIARMVSQGYPNKAIAAVLDISPWTVCTHLRRMFSKLRVNSRAAMVAQVMHLAASRRAAQDAAERDAKERATRPARRRGGPA